MSDDTPPIAIKDPGRYMTYTYVISLSVIAVLSLLVHFMLDRVIAEQSDTARIVNISGQQRMLSQRVSMFTIEYLTLGSPEAKNLAVEALNKMQSNHAMLIEAHKSALANGQASPMSQALQDMYFEDPLNVDAKLTVFAEQIRQALSLTREERSRYAEEIKSGFLALARLPLLAALNTVVSQYERESVVKIDDLRFAQNVVLTIIILTILIEALFVFRPMVRRISSFANRLQYDANYDELSGLLNRRAFQLLAKQAIASSIRHERPLSVVLFDIDHFKQVNDKHGHVAGDEAIKQVADIISEHCREADVVARFGGEEFVVLLPDTEHKKAIHVAEKIRKIIEMTPLQYIDTAIRITSSAGVASLQPGETKIEIPLKRADDALYRAKRDGRNLVRASSDPVETASSLTQRNSTT